MLISGIIHRDIKPENIMLRPMVMKVLDFGLAKLSERGVPDQQSILRAPSTLAAGYFARHRDGDSAVHVPEQAAGGRLMNEPTSESRWSLRNDRRRSVQPTKNEIIVHP